VIQSRPNRVKQKLMCGTDERSGSLFSYVDLETRVPKDHPLRVIREIALFGVSVKLAA
jgi:hypothetical protein